MAIPQQIKPTAPDKRGLGLTFLGMMTDTPKVPDAVYVSKLDHEVAFGILHRRIASLERALLSHLLNQHRPWYTRLWLKIKAFFKGDTRDEQDQHLGDKHPTVAFHRNRSSEHRGQHGD